MIKLSDKLADSLEVLRKLQKNNSSGVIKAKDISRTHKERLLKNGFIQEVMKGWYISTNPEDTSNGTTTWYASYWQFCSEYLSEKFSKEWILSPEQSVSLLSGNKTVPTQLVIKTPKGQNNKVNFLYGASLFDWQSKLPNKNQIEVVDGLRLFSLPYSLINCSSTYFTTNSTDARTALSLIRDPSEILGPLLEGGHSKVAGRLAGAFRNIGSPTIADEIIKTFIAAGYDIREVDPFETSLPLVLTIQKRSPYVNRIQIMWHQMRDEVVRRFPQSPGISNNINAYLGKVDENYQHDAYHSLSIEGYRVSPELIERVRGGVWDPVNYQEDQDQKNTMAARGYWLAFQSVKQSLIKILNGQNSGEVVSNDHRDWYREMFTPSVTAGILRPEDLAGYRNTPVYIKNSMHVPPGHEAVRDAMPKLFELLTNESEPAVRVVLGHFIFEYIHPYPDGNGRIGRFLMNVMLASGGYPWTIVPLEKRNVYMQALEEASVNENILPFTEFMAGLVSEGM